MKMHTIPVTKRDGSIINVTVLASDERAATIMAIQSHGIDPQIRDAQDLLDTGDFQAMWPADVAEALNRAVATEADRLPPYARKQVKWAVRQAGFVEGRMARQEAQGAQVLANLPAAERQAVKV